MRALVVIAAAVLLCCIQGCSPNNVKIDNSLKKYFDDNHVNGTFGLLDNSLEEFTVYNLPRFRDSVFLPASTFDIVNALVGIETGRISNENMVIKWDGVVRKLPGGDSANEWNNDLSMQAAFKASAPFYYQEAARRIGQDTLQHWLDTLGYGARYGKAVIKTGVDTFWLDNSIKVTADEELGLVKKLYFGQLPFQKRTQDIVRKVMLQQQTGKYKLSYKTGLGHTENGDALGWVVGWIEENNHIYFFSLNIENSGNINASAVSQNILMGILGKIGLLNGKM
jgi:beta-lactamase class D